MLSVANWVLKAMRTVEMMITAMAVTRDSRGSSSSSSSSNLPSLIAPPIVAAAETPTCDKPPNAMPGFGPRRGDFSAGALKRSGCVTHEKTSQRM